MPDWRRYSGTKTLQFVWTGLAAVAALVALGISPGAVSPVGLAVGGGLWLAGLLVLGWRERRHWKRLVATSSFESGGPAGTADLQRIVKGHSVTVSTDLPGAVSQTDTVISAAVEGVDAEFTVTLAHAAGDATDEGLTTGNPALDAAWVIQGTPGNVKRLLSPDVQSALMDVSVPGTATVTGERVEYRVPFTRLSADELTDCARAVAETAHRLEAIGRGKQSPTK